MDVGELTHRFSFHPATDEVRKMAHGIVRREILDLALGLNDDLPEGREKALVMTHLEEAMFWANAAIARNQ